ncbi:DNA-binding response OmpR family regulator [Dyadobacter jejuensis]|uniref:DNA-binding response OmpR family regulator n=1 Tax=Dyadobacter jejuensis TaxID=1082580 RepID=A0A316ABI7_9BACT|nr:response regulator transcription factor [Dyadobacter jejuensis]PWJ54991.1 DNA-binding response OmpR family regulator [Dyadobacter jejuensis]
MKILIIEDELELLKSMEEYLSAQEYQCTKAPSFEAAMANIEECQFDCIILDIMLPDGNGLHILKHIRLYHPDEGVIIISAKNAIDDKITGLQLGADDYLAKPFHLSELSARIQSILRRRSLNQKQSIHQNDLEIDVLAKKVTIRDGELVLTKKEYELLLYMIQNKNRVISKSALAEHLSGDFADMLDNHDFVYAHIKNLKKKLNLYDYGQYLKTIYGTGYKWEL